MIEFNAGTFKGEATLEDLKTYREGGLGIPVKVNNTPDAHVLLDNVNKICQVTFELAGKTVVGSGEMVKLSTLRNGGIMCSFVLDKETKLGSFLLANVRKTVTATVAFSSMKGKALAIDPEEAQPKLEGLGEGTD